MLYTQERMQATYEDSEILNLAVDENQGSEIPISMWITDPALPTARYHWQMQLQRYENYAWHEVGEFFGYTDYYSDSNRTFTNVAEWKNTPCRIVVLTSDYYGDKAFASQTFYK